MKEQKETTVEKKDDLVKLWIRMTPEEIDAMKRRTLCDRASTSAKILIRQSLQAQA